MSREVSELGLGNERDDNRKKVFLRTYGCQMNEYDTLKLAALLEHDFKRVPTPDEADLVLINTCSVRDKPEQKLYSLLGELNELKQSRPSMMIGVGGCVAQQEGQRIVERSSAVDFVFGTHNLSLVPSLIDRRAAGFGPQVAVDYRDEWEELPIGFAAPDCKVSAFVSISRGCNKNCTYCIVPTTRGKEVSRAVDEIIREVKIAVHRGAKEIVLLGQTVNSYGRDLNPRLSFVELLERVSEVVGLERIRFTSPHPQEVRQDFIDLVIRNHKVCHHIHMPLQSGSDRILKAMNRNYRIKKYLDIISKLKQGVADIAITTDIIVGFPGETEDDFEQTLKVMEEVGFDNSFSFIFSPRPGTKAAELVDDVDRDVKLERLKRLQSLQQELTALCLRGWIGRSVSVLVEGPSTSDPACMMGRSSQNTVVNFVQPYEGLSTGAIVEAKVTAAARFTLKAELKER